MEILHLLADEAVQVGSSLLGALNPTILALIFGGSLLGLLVGAIPGLTATMALALLINLSYGMPLENAVAFLLAVYIGAVSGGLNAAIMINIPGTPSAAATCLDGFPLAKEGKGGLAIGTGLIASFVGTIFSILRKDRRSSRIEDSLLAAAKVDLDLLRCRLLGREYAGD